MTKRIIEEIKKIKGVRTAFPVDDRIVVDLEEDDESDIPYRDNNTYLLHLDDDGNIIN